MSENRKRKKPLKMHKNKVDKLICMDYSQVAHPSQQRDAQSN